MEIISNVIFLAIGLPIVGGLSIAVIALLRSWCIRNRELKLQEKNMMLEDQRLRDEMNVKLLHADTYGSAEVAALSEEVRMLREEIRQIKQDLDSRIYG